MEVSGMLALRGGKIYTVTQGCIEGGSVLVEGSRIIDVGKDIRIPEGTHIYDLAHQIVTPGLIDCHTHLGIAVEGSGSYGNDKNEADLALGPHLRALDGINPEDAGLRDARCGGITAILVTPGSENVMGGLSVAIKTAGKVVDQMVLRHPAGLKVAFGENPKRKAMEKQSGCPSTRMGIAALVREQFVKAQNYLLRGENDMQKQRLPQERDLTLEALAGVLKGEYPMRAHAHAAEDIMTAIRIAEEFSIPLILEHATEGHKIAEEIARRNIPCNIGPTLTARVKVELQDRRYETATVLQRAGVKIALVTDHPIQPVNTLRMEVVMAISHGLSEEAAWRAVTIDAAEIMGVSRRIGSIEKEKDADLVVWSGHPFDIYAKVRKVFINGQLEFAAE
jgi:imidazolonepropionase-like amidohydrolase